MYRSSALLESGGEYMRGSKGGFGGIEYHEQDLGGMG